MDGWIPAWEILQYRMDRLPTQVLCKPLRQFPENMTIRHSNHKGLLEKFKKASISQSKHANVKQQNSPGKYCLARCTLQHEPKTERH